MFPTRAEESEAEILSDGSIERRLQRVHAKPGRYEIATALRNPGVAERLQGLGLQIVADTPEEFARFVAAESEKMRRLVQVSGARVD